VRPFFPPHHAKDRAPGAPVFGGMAAFRPVSSLTPIVKMLRSKPSVSEGGRWLASAAAGAAQQRPKHAAYDLPPDRAAESAGGALGKGLSQSVATPSARGTRAQRSKIAIPCRRLHYATPDFLWGWVGSANFMRLSAKRAAPVAVGVPRSRKSGFFALFAKGGAPVVLSR
jgi:thiamine pyrophosphate-dependent acetolactate synthase large subunit-like protein